MSQGLEFSFLKDWGGWDEIDTGCLQFYKPVFRDDVGLPQEVMDIPTEEACFILDISSSTIQICDESADPVFESKVKLVLV